MANDPTDLTKFPVPSSSAYVLERNTQDIDTVVNGGNQLVTTRNGRQIPSLEKVAFDLGAVTFRGNYAGATAYTVYDAVFDAAEVLSSPGAWYIAPAGFTSVDIATDVAAGDLVLWSGASKSDLLKTTFYDLSAISSAPFLSVGDYVRTFENQSNYVIVSGGTGTEADGYFDLAATGLQAKILSEPLSNDAQYGAISDQATDDTTAVNNALNNSDLTRIQRTTKHDSSVWDSNEKIATDRKDALGMMGVTAASLPRLFRKLREWNDVTSTDIKIYGMGSSVGNGAGLVDPANDAPVIKFWERLNSKFNKLNNKTINKTNASVDGSTLFQAINDGTLATVLGNNPDLLVLAYGMNDGGPAIYHAGQTYNGVYTYLAQIIQEAHAVDCDVVVMTSPHPKNDAGSFYWPPGIDCSYPEALTAPTGEQLTPPISGSVVTADWAGVGVNVPASYRHQRVNEAMRQCCIDHGVPVIDAEYYWFDALAKRNGDDSGFFDAGEYLHFNLEGHRQSYWRAMFDFIDAMAETYNHGIQQNSMMYGRLGVNRQSTDVALDIQPVGNDGILKFRDSSGNIVLSIDANGISELSGDLAVSGGILSSNDSVYGTESRQKTIAARNIGSTFQIQTASGACGELLIKAYQPGIGTQVRKIWFVNVGGAVTISDIFYFETAALDVTTISTNGSNIEITPFTTGTNLDITFFEMS